MRLLLLPVMLLSLALAGCAGGGFGKSVLEGGLSITATVQNPITREHQAAIEASYGVAVAAAVAYSRLPRCKAGQSTSITNLCSRWPVVQKLMAADAKVHAALVRLRDFMDRNQTISAIGAFNAARAALGDLKAVAFVNNIEN